MSKLHRFLLAMVIILATSCEKDIKKQDIPPVSTPEKPLFQALNAEQTGLNFNKNGAFLFKGDPSGLYSNVSAVAAGDINNDGLVDLLFSGGHQNSGLYLNLGDLKFKNISASAGIIDPGEKFADTEGLNFVDINGDGLLDIYIIKTGLRGNFKSGQFQDWGANLLFINKGNNKFEESASKYGLDLIGLSHTANFFDYDADGDLDVYMGYTAEPGASFSFPYYKKPPRSKWLNDQFLENVNGKYVDVRKKAGLPFERNVALSVSVGDINNDGYGDIYVTNDFFGRDFFFLNNGDKTFSDAHSKYFSKAPMSAMGSDFADINNDGWLDLFVGEMMPQGNARQKQNMVPFSIDIYNRLLKEKKPQYTRNMLQLNRGGKKFSDIGLMAGVHATEWSWSSFFIDMDNDGHKDLFVANGILRDLTDMDFVKDNFGVDYTTMADPDAKAKVNAHKAPIVKTPNYFYKNKGDHSFQSMNSTWKLNQPMQTRGATYADLDNDGDLELILNNMDAVPVIYKNLATEQKRGNFLKIALKAKAKNTFGIGAKVDIRYAGGLQQNNYISTHRGFQSCPESLIHFGLGQAQKVDTLIITWPGGKSEAHFNIAGNQLLKLEQGQGTAWNGNQKNSTPLFAKTTNGPSFKHKENNYSDFKKERIQIKRLSKEGPGIAASDINNDGISDLLITGASGQGSKLFTGNSDGSFTTAKLPGDTKSEDLGVVFFDANGDGFQDLYIGSGQDETKENNTPDQLFMNDGKGNFQKDEQALPAIAKGTKVVCVADYDQDGDQDIFIAERRTAGAKTFGSSCHLLLNEKGRFTPLTKDFPSESMGEVSSAIWTDVNNDGKKDLAVAGRWMPLTFFIQSNNTFSKKEITNSAGWWNSIIASDVDNDGDMDYVLGNQGLNSKFKASPNKPITLAYGDFDKNGNMDPLVFNYVGNVNAPFVNKDLLTSHMPAFNKRFYNFKQYSITTFDNMLTDADKTSADLRYAKELRSGVFINDGSANFKFLPFGNEIQMAPVHGIISEDLNGDGHVDIFLLGNSNSNHFEYGDIDALGSALLTGKGDGTFNILSEAQSGIDCSGFGKSMVMWSQDDKSLSLTIGRNNDSALSYKLNKGVEIIKCPIGKSSAKIQLSNGKTRKWEYAQGGGYLSQSAPIILKTAAVKAVVFH